MDQNKSIILACLLFSVIYSSSVFAIDSTHCLKGCPDGAPNSNTVLQRPIYVLSNNKTTKFADWVAYKVDETNFGPEKTRNFKLDPDLDASTTLCVSDYKDAFKNHKYDKGHLAPLASFEGSPHWAMTNYMSNITPQHLKLNRGPWKVLEARIRDYAIEWGVPVYVVSGTLYDANVAKLPKSSKTHRVPSGYYKVIATLEDGQIYTTGFVFHQTNPTYTTFVITGSPLTILNNVQA